MSEGIKSFLSIVFVGLLKAYKAVVSPYSGGFCRYVPSCSAYSTQAVAHYGVLRGGWLTVCRLSRCHPFGGRGFDPVP